MEYNKSKWEIKYDNYKKDKEEIKQKMLSIRREQATLKEGPEYASKKRELEELKKKENEYNAIGKNESKIENIIEYKRELSEKNEELLKQKKAIDLKENKVSKIETKIEEQYKQIDKLLNKLNSGKMKEEDKTAAYDKITKYTSNINQLTADKENLENELNNSGKEKIEQEIEKNNRLISKCNLIGANLLKGKNMDDIKTKLSNFEIAPNAKLSDKKEKAKSEKNKEQEEKQQGENRLAEEEKQGENKIGNEKENKPAEVSKFNEFLQKHPKIAATWEFIKHPITGMKKIGKNIVDIFKQEDDKEIDENNISEKTVEEKEKTPYDKENEDLLAITEQGVNNFRESIKISKKQQLEEMRRNKAKEYAEKYGGRYETQDGANLDKQDDMDR